MIIQRWFLMLVTILNVVGTVWGFFWYWQQLQETVWYLVPFVPDCPLHAMFFAMFAYWLMTRNPMTALWQQVIVWMGILGSIKYGIWTVVIVGQFFSTLSSWPMIDDLLLFISHCGMLLQGLVYLHFLPEATQPAMVAITWFIANDFFDYIFNTHPALPLEGQYLVAGWLSIGLTALIIIITAGRFYFFRDHVKQ